MLNTPLPRLSTDSIGGLSSPTVNWNHTRLRLQNLVFCGANACSDRKVMQLAGEICEPRRYWAGKRGERDPHRHEYAAALGRVTQLLLLGGGFLVRPPRLRPRTCVLDFRRVRFDDRIWERFLPIDARNRRRHLVWPHAGVRRRAVFSARWPKRGQHRRGCEPRILARYSTRRRLCSPRGGTHAKSGVQVRVRRCSRRVGDPRGLTRERATQSQ